MTPEQLEREAANRVQHMGYDDEPSDAERWHRFRGDAQLVAATNDVLWERVHELEAAAEMVLRADKLWLIRRWRMMIALGRLRAALAGGSDG